MTHMIQRTCYDKSHDKHGKAKVNITQLQHEFYSISSVDSASTTFNLFQIGNNDNNKQALQLTNECPATICIIETISSIRNRKILRVLLDSGSSACLIKRSCLPQGVTPKVLTNAKLFSTLAGKLQTQSVVTLQRVRLPEFDKNRCVNEQDALVFDNDGCKYDIIFGTNFLSKVGIKLDYDTGQMQWFDNILPMRPHQLTSSDFITMEDQYFIQLEDEILGEEWLDCYATEILDAKYEWTNVKDVVSKLTHLDQSQRDDLLIVLTRHVKIFDGTLGVYPHKRFHIEIDKDAKPVYARHYPIPRIHLSTFKKELDHLVKLGVLVHQQESEWASPTFIIPKKDGRVLWISDLRQLNKVFKRKQ